MSNLETIRSVWLSYSRQQRDLFLDDKEHSTSEIFAAIDSMDEIPTGGSVCVICVAKTLNSDVSAMQDSDEIAEVLNRSLGKTFGKPSKQKTHNSRAKHEHPHFCSSTSKLRRVLQLWRLGLTPIDGIYCKSSNTLSSSKLKS